MDLFQRAEEAFREGVQARDQPSTARRYFRAAAVDYESLTRQGVHNTDLFYNLGNASLLAGDLPRAIWAYRRGLHLSPGDPRLRAHLAFTREQVVYAEASNLGRPSLEQWPPWLPWVPASVRLASAVVLYSLACLVLTRWWMTRHGRLLGVGIALILGAVLLSVTLGIESWSMRQERLHPLVVIAEDEVVVRSGNGYSYPARFAHPLNRGVEARLLFSRGDWLKIELNGGQLGWVPRNKVLTDAP
jgi:hypothetical protein